MIDSILESIKLLLGIQTTNTDFDSSIIMNINSVFSRIHQLGLDNPDGDAFRISGNTETWSDFWGERTDLEFIKSYVFAKVRLVFDPPQNSFLVKALQDQISEFEWLIEPHSSIIEEVL